MKGSKGMIAQRFLGSPHSIKWTLYELSEVNRYGRILN